MIKAQQVTKVFAKAGLDKLTSAMYYYRQRFGLDVHYSALVYNFNHINTIGHLYRADTAAIPCLRKYSNVVRNAKKAVLTTN